MRVYLRIWPIIAMVVLSVSLLLSISLGPDGFDLKILSFFATGNEAEIKKIILLEIRLPRSLLALLVGAALGLSGAAIQGMTRNPLAEPAILGFSGSAALGAVIAFYSGLAVHWPLLLPLGAILFCFLGAGLLLILAGRYHMHRLILAGVALSSLTAALTSLALNLSPNPFAALEIILWLLGSVANRGMDQFWLATPFIFLGAVLLFSQRRALDLLSLGEETAVASGLDWQSSQKILLAGLALCVGAATAVCGIVGFVGLIVPHLCRPVVRHRPGALLLPSTLLGGLLLLWADMLVRFAPFPSELKLGVVTALLGAPFFFHLILKSRQIV